MKKFFADGNKRQTLLEHIHGVRTSSAAFSEKFDCHVWGGLLGDWHDLGKFMGAFQAYMLERATAVEHAVVGGRYSSDAFPEAPYRRLALQFCMTCHHTGLQNRTHLQERLAKASELLHDAITNAPEELLKKELPE